MWKININIFIYSWLILLTCRIRNAVDEAKRQGEKQGGFLQLAGTILGAAAGGPRGVFIGQMIDDAVDNLIDWYQ